MAIGVKGQESDIYKIQNLKYKQQLSALFFDDADFLYLVVFLHTIIFLFVEILLPLQLEKTSRVKLSLDSFLVITKPASLKQCNVRVECLPAHVLETWALGSYGYR